MSPTAVSHTEKSTNVRSYSTPMRVALAGLRALDHGAPELAARLAERLMFRTTRRATSPWEFAALATAEPFTTRSASGLVRAWSWGSGPPVVLAHGWNGRGSQLAALVDPLLDAGYRVVTFDAPGHGASPGYESSLVDFANALDAVIDEVRPPFGRVHAVIAHSMGGAAATYSMSRHARSPLLGLERALRDNGLPVSRFAFLAPPVDVRDFIRGFAKRTGIGEDTTAALRRRVETRFGVPLAELDAVAAAQDLDAPLLVVHDEQDREVPVRCGKQLAAAWPGARLHLTDGLGHGRILRDPKVIDLIVDFVARGDDDAWTSFTHHAA